MIDRYSLTGLSPFFDRPCKQVREVRSDRYGIRSVLEMEGALIKFEIVREGRIALENSKDQLYGVPMLARSDAFAEKILANSDSWADRALLSRDLLDLAAKVSVWGDIPRLSERKAIAVYGPSASADVASAAQRLVEEEGYRQECVQKLCIDPAIQGGMLSVLRELADRVCGQSLLDVDELGKPGPAPG